MYKKCYFEIQCDHTMSLDALHQGVLSPPTKIAVIGSGCSVATEPAAEISHYYNLTQVLLFKCCKKLHIIIIKVIKVIIMVKIIILFV